MEINLETTTRTILKQLPQEESLNLDKNPPFFVAKSIMHALEGEKKNININEDFVKCREIGYLLQGKSQAEVTAIIQKLYNEIADKCEKNEEGTTLIIAFYYLNDKGEWTISAGNLGDSSLFLVEYSADESLKTCKQINELHTAENEKERERLFLIGKHTILNKRLNGVIMPLRTIGDASVTRDIIGNSKHNRQLSEPQTHHVTIKENRINYLAAASDGFTDETCTQLPGMGLKSDPNPQYFIEQAFNNTFKKENEQEFLAEITERLYKATTTENNEPEDDWTLGVAKLVNKSFILFLCDGHGARQSKRYGKFENPTVQYIKENIIDLLYQIIPQSDSLKVNSRLKSWLDSYNHTYLNNIILKILLFTFNLESNASNSKEFLFSIRKMIYTFKGTDKESYQQLFGGIYSLARKHVSEENTFCQKLEQCSMSRQLAPLNKFFENIGITGDFTPALIKLFAHNLLEIAKKSNAEEYLKFIQMHKMLLDNASNTITFIQAMDQYLNPQPNKKLTADKKTVSTSTPELQRTKFSLKVFSKSSPALLNYSNKPSIVGKQLNIIINQLLHKPLTESINTLADLANQHKMDIKLQSLPETASSIDPEHISSNNCNG